jgi:hypothetical protein
MSVSTANTISTLNGLFKITYGDKLVNLIPEGTKLVKDTQFIGKDKQPGLQFNMPVVLGLEHGISYGGTDEGAFDLQQPIAGQIKEAQVKGNQMLLRSAIGYAQITRSLGSSAAFQNSTKFLVANMMRSLARKLEVNLMYGQVGLATVASTSSNVITVTTAEWAPGIWSGSEKMKLEIRSAAGALRGQCQITAVSISGLTLTVDALPVGTVSTDIIYEAGAYSKEAAGLHKIITNNSVLYNIDASAYTLWAGNTYSAGSANLTFSKIQSAIALAVAKGLDSDVNVYVSIYSWPNLLAEQAAFRKYEVGYTPDKMKQGAKALEFYGQNGMIRIIPSIYVKQGYAYVVDPNDLMRVGSTDITFRLQGLDQESFFHVLENNAGVGMRCFSDQALFSQAPGRSVLINNIVNS